ncbi:MAG: DNA-binding protein [Candidatus Omnitrophica bacterium]|nr:DNA-binding protein [Candidatus Omnitrophota bacterium]
MKRLKFKILIFLFLIFALSLLTPNSQLMTCYAGTISSKNLIERANQIDGRRVTYEGEIIGAIMDRGEYSWINVSDSNNAIGIWCKSDMLKDIKFIGDYKQQGDILEIKGIFNRACPEHNGELDIHADSVKIIKAGFLTPQKFSKRNLKISAILFLATAFLMLLVRWRASWK